MNLVVTTHDTGLKRTSYKRFIFLTNKRFKVGYLWKIWRAGADFVALSPKCLAHSRCLLHVMFWDICSDLEEWKRYLLPQKIRTKECQRWKKPYRSSDLEVHILYPLSVQPFS